MPCFFLCVIETRVKEQSKKCCDNTSRQVSVSTLFRALPNFHECCFNSTETQRTCFLFLLENSATKKRKQLVYRNCLRPHYVNSVRKGTELVANKENSLVPEIFSRTRILSSRLNTQLKTESAKNCRSCY